MNYLTEDEVETIEAITNLQIDMLYNSLAEHFELESGDVTPCQTFEMDDLKDGIKELMFSYVLQNK